MFGGESLYLPAARGDGGTVRLSERQRNYQITVFTAPTPLRAGPVDFSVLVQDADSLVPLTDVDVTLEVTASGHAGQAAHYRASHESATNKLFQAVQFELPAAGGWEFSVQIEGLRGSAQSRFQLEAMEPLPRWIEVWGWIALPVLPIFLFLIQLRAKRPGLGK